MTRIALAAAAFAATLAASAAHAATLDELSVLCAANPGCTRSDGAMNGAMTFRIVRDSVVIRISCTPDGVCLRSYPKGRSVAIADVTALFAGH